MLRRPAGWPISLGDREGALRLSIHVRRCPWAGTKAGQWAWERGGQG